MQPLQLQRHARSSATGRNSQPPPAEQAARCANSVAPVPTSRLPRPSRSSFAQQLAAAARDAAELLAAAAAEREAATRLVASIPAQQHPQRRHIRHSCGPVAVGAAAASSDEGALSSRRRKSAGLPVADFGAEAAVTPGSPPAPKPAATADVQEQVPQLQMPSDVVFNEPQGDDGFAASSILWQQHQHQHDPGGLHDQELPGYDYQNYQLQHQRLQQEELREERTGLLACLHDVLLRCCYDAAAHGLLQQVPGSKLIAVLLLLLLRPYAQQPQPAQRGELDVLEWERCCCCYIFKCRYDADIYFWRVLLQQPLQQLLQQDNNVLLLMWEEGAKQWHQLLRLGCTAFASSSNNCDGAIAEACASVRRRRRHMSRDFYQPRAELAQQPMQRQQPQSWQQKYARVDGGAADAHESTARHPSLQLHDASSSKGFLAAATSIRTAMPAARAAAYVDTAAMHAVQENVCPLRANSAAAAAAVSGSRPYEACAAEPQQQWDPL
ncbi:hypothetical protein cyc_03704 [Cyclospora cayetanensis]|uniref:Uncharacterized protein n=1 Tax=Cyclospora cayetanensis TaxID=88456 RepID=A0A1D3CSW6_9EIME|nr:hypothetical protein cyc_03704 [Cyclospora cayetanensis]